MYTHALIFYLTVIFWWHFSRQRWEWSDGCV